MLLCASPGFNKTALDEYVGKNVSVEFLSTLRKRTLQKALNKTDGLDQLWDAATYQVEG